MPDTKQASDLARWQGAQYVAAVGLAAVEGSAAFAKFAAAFPAPSSGRAGPYPLAGRVRMSSFLRLRLGYPLGAAGYACLTAAAAVAGAAPTHYLYAYWRRDALGGPPEYICVAPTLDSRDGEYRPRFVSAAVFLRKYEEMADQFAPFEEKVLAMVADHTLRLTVAIYPEGAASEVAPSAAPLRLPVVALAVAMALDLWETRRGLAAAHTSRQYVALMRALAEAMPAAAETSSVNQSLLSYFIRGTDDTMYVQCGQKLVPMYAREVAQPFDATLAAWRELAAARAVADLVVNFVAPGFPLYNEWTYVEGAGAALFENPAMAEKYARGRKAGAALEALRGARRALDDDPSYHAEMLNARVYDCLEYAQSHLAVSDVAMLHTMENVGLTLGALGAYVRLRPRQHPDLAGLFAQRASAARLLFEYAYAAHCAHTKLGLAHTDLHRNNLTVYRWAWPNLGASPSGEAAPDAERLYDDPVVAYVAGPRGEADTYVFAATGFTGCVIDFSRCVLGPAFRPRLEAGQSPQRATNVYRDQVNRVMRTLHRYAPEYVAANQDAIKAAAIGDFDSLFPALCAVDFLAIGASVAALLHDEAGAADPGELRPFPIVPEAIALAQRLEDAGRTALIEGLHRVVARAHAPSDGGARPRAPEAPEPRREARGHAPRATEGRAAFSGAAILAQVFGEWRFPEWAAREPRRARTAQLVDAYNYNNELRWSASDYDRFPPWARLDELERHLGEYKVTDVFERGVEAFLDSLQPSARVEVVAERARAAAEKLDGRPVSTSSSWIDE